MWTGEFWLRIWTYDWL